MQYGKRIFRSPKPIEPEYGSFEWCLGRAGQKCRTCYDLNRDHGALVFLDQALERGDDSIRSDIEALRTGCTGCGFGDAYVANGIGDVIKKLREKGKTR